MSNAVVFAGALLVLAPSRLGAGDVEFSYDTGHSLGPHYLYAGFPTCIEISLVNRGNENFGIGGILFDLELIGGSASVTWDIGGPDNQACCSFDCPPDGEIPPDPPNCDNGFQWEPWLDGSPHPVTGAGDVYYACPGLDNRHAQTGLAGFPRQAVIVPSGSSRRVAMFVVTGRFGAEGDWALLSFGMRSPNEEILLDSDLRLIPDLNGTENVVLTVTESCAAPADCNDSDVCTRDRCDGSSCSSTPISHGDIDGNTFINLFDIFCVLDGFEGDFSRCQFEHDDLSGACCVPGFYCCPDGTIDIRDLFAILDAYQGIDPCCGVGS